LDKKNLLPGQTWNLKIRKAIKNSRYFIALFSSTSVQKRGYIQKEFRFALDLLDEFPDVSAVKTNTQLTYSGPEGRMKIRSTLDALFDSAFLQGAHIFPLNRY